MAEHDDELTITLTRREWVKIGAALVMRAERDPKVQPIIDKLHPVVIAPMWADAAGEEQDR